MDFNIAERDHEEDDEEHQRINVSKSRPKSDSSKFNVSGKNRFFLSILLNKQNFF